MRVTKLPNEGAKGATRGELLYVEGPTDDKLTWSISGLGDTKTSLELCVWPLSGYRVLSSS